MIHLSEEELNLLSEVGEKLSLHDDALAACLQKALVTTAVYHEHLFTDEELQDLSKQYIDELMEALSKGEMYTAPEAVREKGSHFALEGVGDRSLAESLSAVQESCLSLVYKLYQDASRERALLVTARALSRYGSLFTEGYLQASRDCILDAQDDIITALEQSLRESEQWLAITLKSIGDGVIATDIRGLVTFMNPVAEALTGWTQREAKGLPLQQVFYIINEETRKRCENPFEKIIVTGKVVGLANSTVLVARDGREKLIADSGAPIRDETGTVLGTVLVFRDITEKRKMEEDILLLKTEKMDSISILAGGIAHDFNNILTAILGNITMAKSHTHPGEEIFKILTEAEKASMRAKNLTQQLLTFSKGGAPVRKPASVAELIRSTADFALSGSKTECEIFIPENLYSVDIDAGQISQVIHNLIINAGQAMPAGGIITVRAGNVTVGSHDGLPLKEGDYVRISVEDEGIGIPKAHLQRIFEPYFTTKQKGSGLGLTTSYSIVKNHDGCITVESDLGLGTKFHVFLPASQKKVVIMEESRKPVQGKGRILLMDDEESILEATGEVLTYLGYTVEVAREGSEAVELYKKRKESGKPFDCVVVDLTIRGKMGGKETIQKLLKIDPKVKAIVSSGYSDDPVMANFREYGFKGVVTKPYTVEELSETLSEVLGTSDSDHQ